MTGGNDAETDFGADAGGPARHVPVMLHEVLDALALRSGSRIVDGTFGAGGYSAAILARGARVLAIDRDPSAIEGGAGLVAQSGGALVLARGNFAQLDRIAAEHSFAPADGVVLDIGVSSMQLDEAERGFSFRKDGPLDMRMGDAGPSAADVVNRAQQNDLIRIIGILGEERQAARVARAIVARREARPFERTLDLAGVVANAVGKRPGDRIHPATRTFQGLRIYVNGELDELAIGLSAAERLLREGGRLVVVTFHSLEDRIVKRFLAERTGGQGGSRHLPQSLEAEPSFRLEKKGAIAASEAEAQANPRARSAKLRYALRTGAPAAAEHLAAFGLPNLVPLSSFANIAGARHA